ncbi:MAG: methylated-DNA--[protein]-cysteine S-methyltransferase [Ilumatobacteraceae bacterium]
MQKVGEMLFSRVIESPVGDLLLVASDDGLRALLWTGPSERVAVGQVDGGEHDPAGVLDSTVAQLIEYFAGTRTDFDVPLDPVGSPFQQSAWDALRTIPYGETVTYGEQARRLGDIRKARAVGAANGKNPISIIVPCHRVVGSNGSLTGFGGGIANKAWLLDHERRVWIEQLMSN